MSLHDETINHSISLSAINQSHTANEALSIAQDFSVFNITQPYDRVHEQYQDSDSASEFSEDSQAGQTVNIPEPASKEQLWPSSDEELIEQGSSQSECSSQNDQQEKIKENNTFSKISRIFAHQEQLIASSVLRNSIVYLPTGKGKTLIALCNMIFLQSLPQFSNKKKKIVFLANTVQLVKQQYSYLLREYNKVQSLVKTNKFFKDLYSKCKIEQGHVFENRLKDSQISCIHGQKVEKEPGDNTRSFIIRKNKTSASKKLKDSLEKSSIIVCISQIFLDSLRRGMLDLEKVGLIIFDECHHTYKQHSYNCIMQEVYLRQKHKGNKEMPLILGLTASPVTRLTNIDKANTLQIRRQLLELSSNLDSRLAKIQNKIYKNLRTTQAVQIEELDEADQPKGYSPYFDQLKLINHIEDLLGKTQEYWISNIDLISVEFPQLAQLISNVIQILNNFQKSLRKKKLKDEQFLKEVKSVMLNRLPLIWLQLGKNALYNYLIKLREKLQKMQTYLNYVQLKRDLIEAFKIGIESLQKCGDIQDRSNFSSKILIILKIVKKELKMATKPPRILIFAKERLIVTQMAKTLNRIFESDTQYNFLKKNKEKARMSACAVVGATSQTKNINNKDEILPVRDPSNIVQFKQIIRDIVDKDHKSKYQKLLDNQQAIKKLFNRRQHYKLFFSESEKINEQLKKIDSFRKGHKQIIISTSVIEEGFDISDCKCVIAFDRVTQLKSFIQMKGRARYRESNFYLIALNKNEKSENVQKVQKFERMIEMIENEVQFLANANEDQYKKEIQQIQKQIKLPNVVEVNISTPDQKKTKVLVSMNNAATILQSYCNSHRYQEKIKHKIIKTKTEGLGVRVAICMPHYCKLANKVIEGDLEGDKRSAYLKTCMKAVVELIKNKELDSNLNCIRIKRSDKMITQLKSLITQDSILDMKEKGLVSIDENKISRFRQNRADPFYVLTDSLVHSIFLIKIRDTRSLMTTLLKCPDEEVQIGLIYPRPRQDCIDAFQGCPIRLHNNSDQQNQIYVDFKFLGEVTIDVHTRSSFKKVHYFLSLSSMNSDIELYSLLSNKLPQGFFENRKRLNEEKRVDKHLMLTLVNKQGLAKQQIEKVIKYVDSMESAFKYINQLKTLRPYKDKLKQKKDQIILPIGQSYEILKNLQLDTPFSNSFIVQSVDKKSHFNKYIINSIRQVPYFPEKEKALQGESQVKPQEKKEKTDKAFTQIKNLYNFKWPKEYFQAEVTNFNKLLKKRLYTNFPKCSEIIEVQSLKKGNPVPLVSLIVYPLSRLLFFKLFVIIKGAMPQVTDSLIAQKFKLSVFQELNSKAPMCRERQFNRKINQALRKDYKLIQNYKNKEPDSKTIIAIQQYKRSSIPPPISRPLPFRYEPTPITTKMVKQSIYALAHGNSNLSQNYQVLQFVGDSVLKFLTTIELFIQDDQLQQSKMHTFRCMKVSNKFLFETAINFRLYEFLLCKSTKWFVPGVALNEEEQHQQFREIPIKSLSDVVQSTLGLTFIASRDLNQCRVYLANLNVLDFHQINTTITNYEYSAPFFQEFMENIQITIDYRFKDLGILFQALCQVSFCAYENITCYNRLQFLGDSFIDVMVVQYLYDRHTFNIDQGAYTARKQNVVCNKSLCILAYRLGLHKRCLVTDANLVKYIEQIEGKFEQAVENPHSLGQSIEEQRAVKIMGDCFEALVGAVLVDQGFDYSKTRQVILPLMVDHIQLYSSESQILKGKSAQFLRYILQRRIQYQLIKDQDNGEWYLIDQEGQHLSTAVKAKDEKSAWEKIYAQKWTQ